MGRKKNTTKENRIDNTLKDRLDFSLSADVRKNVFGVVLLTMAILITLGFLGMAGVVGEFLNKLISQAIGWAKMVFPIFLILASVVLFFGKKTTLYVAKLIGLFSVFISIVGFLHWFFDFSKMRAVAEEGMGGGYLGYFVAHTSIQYLGNAGSFVVILSLLILGFIFAFEFSIIDFISRVKSIELNNKKKSDDVIDSDDVDDSDSDEISLEKKTKKEDDPMELGEEDDVLGVENKSEVEEIDADLVKENIRKIKFVEGRDQFDFSDDDDVETDEDIDNNNNSFNDVVPLSAMRKTPKADWKFPPLNILEKSSGTAKGGDVELNATLIEDSLRNFGIEVERGEIKTGPSVTQYSFRPAVGVKIAKILALQNDLSLALANTIRIEAPIPGKSLIGIEVPNKKSATVCLRSVLESKEFKNRKSNLTIALGEDVSGNYILGSLDKMPHLMVAGATGTGKSVCVNSIISSLLYQNSSDDLKLIMVDPKRVELSLYNGIPHLLTPVIVENAKVVNTLRWAVGEMERRYKLFQEVGVRDIISYKERRDSGEKRVLTDDETGEVEEIDMENVPYIVIIIDELADLMISHGKEVEGAIVRIAQMARAVGIHLIVSTQRPSVEVITGLIKANIATRISFQVASQVDSRTVLDMAGAEKLLGRGDLLYLSNNSPKPQRVQGVFITEKEVKDIVKFIKEENSDFADNGASGAGGEVAITSGPSPAKELDHFNSYESDDNNDELYEAAKKEIMQSKKASASFLQRRLRVGYARAARLLDILEEKGVVGPADGAKPREIFGLSEAKEIAYTDDIVDQEKRDKWQV